jgi:predicted ATP-dependent endonuclease of OLD family
MILSNVYIRFYKSFNYDYLGKLTRKSFNPWDKIENVPYPFIQIPIETGITTVVGANESGKSHLLSAIRKGINGSGIEWSDFCRFSSFRKISKGQMRWPEFGFEWVKLSEPDKKSVSEIASVDEGSFDKFHFFRTSPEIACLYFPGSPKVTLTKEQTEAIVGILPKVYEINSSLELPDSVPLRFLAYGEQDGGDAWDIIDRESGYDILEKMHTHRASFESVNAVTGAAPTLHAEFSPLLHGKTNKEKEEFTKKKKQFELVRDLICEVAQVDTKALQTLYSSLKKGDRGVVDTILEDLNRSLSVALNFPKYWAQDKQFELKVATSERDLVFTVRDRTATNYKFSERSSGLKYFLSYYAQYLTYKPKGDNAEILLMDEPDAFLSSQAQHDLLKIFDRFAFPENPKEAIQVVYVTHSPFLIDKNHATRVRVLDKGKHDQGTRVVRDVSRNHYEPLRSAFGVHVAESTFIGNCNLILEGVSDQVILSGTSQLLQGESTTSRELLDLNSLTLVPGGGAPSIPYLVYLARGRDEERPMVVVLLDSDSAGNEAREALKKGIRNKKILREDLVLQIGELAPSNIKFNIDSDQAIEDMIPPDIALEACRRYIITFAGEIPNLAEGTTNEKFEEHLANCHSTLKALQALVSPLLSNFKLDKIAFARFVMEICKEVNSDATSSLTPAVKTFKSNFRILFSAINGMIAHAQIEASERRIDEKIRGIKQVFINDHETVCSKDEALSVLEHMLEVLDETFESDAIATDIRLMIQKFELRNEMEKPLPDFPKFKSKLESLEYKGKLMSQEEGLERPVLDSPGESTVVTQSGVLSDAVQNPSEPNA